jgi:hypothetical protein
VLRVKERGFKGGKQPETASRLARDEAGPQTKLGARERKCRDEWKEMSTCLIDYTTWLLRECSRSRLTETRGPAGYLSKKCAKRPNSKAKTQPGWKCSVGMSPRSAQRGRKRIPIRTADSVSDCQMPEGRVFVPALECKSRGGCGCGCGCGLNVSKLPPLLGSLCLVAAARPQSDNPRSR